MPARREAVPALDHRPEQRVLHRLARGGGIACHADDVGGPGHELRIALAEEALHPRHGGLPAGVGAGAQHHVPAEGWCGDACRAEPGAVVGTHHDLVADARLQRELFERIAQRDEARGISGRRPADGHRNGAVDRGERGKFGGQRAIGLRGRRRTDPLHVHPEVDAAAGDEEVRVASTRRRALDVDRASGFEQSPREYRLGHRAQEEVLAGARLFQRFHQAADLPAGDASAEVGRGRRHPGEDLLPQALDIDR